MFAELMKTVSTWNYVVAKFRKIGKLTMLDVHRSTQFRNDQDVASCHWWVLTVDIRSRYASQFPFLLVSVLVEGLRTGLGLEGCRSRPRVGYIVLRLL